MPQSKQVIVIGSGFGGLGVAAIMAKAGYQVTVLEKNEGIGGRASILEAEGFRFDMGPSWYLMPDMFEHFFTLFGKRPEELLDLKKLDPSYRIFFKEINQHMDFSADIEQTAQQFESIEKGAGKAFKHYLEKSKEGYEIAVDRFIYKNYNSITDFFTWEMITAGQKLSVFKKMDTYVRKHFNSPILQKVLQYPLVFLGGSPYNTPALYNIMNHIDFNMGVFYPMGGIFEVVQAIANLAKENGATIRTNAEVKRILVENGNAIGVELQNGERLSADIVISNADIHHTETALLPEPAQSFESSYWENRTLSPSAAMVYLGVDKRLKNIQHHNLVFCDDWRHNFAQIFDTPEWPDDPSYYVSIPSVTDPSVAPEGKENLVMLVPIAPKLTYTKEQLTQFIDGLIDDFGQQIGEPELREHVCFRQEFCVDDFTSRYNSYGGSALGLGHTLLQTAVFRPDTVSKKVPNLYYVGGNTNPGIGMPMCLASAQLVYKRITGNTSAKRLTTLE